MKFANRNPGFAYHDFLISRHTKYSLPFISKSLELCSMPQFQIFTMMFGAHYINLFKRACFKSMNWPKNQAAIRDKTWHVYTKPEHFEELTNLFKDMPYKLNLIGIADSQRVTGCGFVPTSQCDQGVILLNGLRDQILNSVQNNQKILFAPPDTIFGDGTIPNLIALGAGPKTCVAVAHARVIPSILDEIDYLCATRGSISNAQLVSHAFMHAHDSWRFAEIGHEKNSSFVGGIAWKKLESNLYSVQHRLPTHYFLDFNEQDWDFWWGTNSFGAFDHRWPAENLIRQQRQRYVGSSDACMIVEVTDWDKNVPPEVKEKPPTNQQDLYWNSHYHNIINRGMCAIFRGE